MEYKTIKVNQEWLKWVRTSLKYSINQVGQKLKIKPETIKQWEETGIVPCDKLEKMSNLYDVNSIIFLNSKTPHTIVDSLTDFRTTKNKKIDKTPEILKEIKRAKIKRELIIDLQEKLNEDVSFNHDKNITSEPECVKTMIECLEISNSNRQNYKFKDWLRLFESKDILIFQFYNIDPNDIRGYAVNYSELPIIGINYSDSGKAKIFTLFHEFAHILLKEDGISGDRKNKVEQKCNKIVSEVFEKCRIQYNQ